MFQQEIQLRYWIPPWSIDMSDHWRVECVVQWFISPCSVQQSNAIPMNPWNNEGLSLMVINSWKIAYPPLGLPKFGFIWGRGVPNESRMMTFSGKATAFGGRHWLSLEENNLTTDKMEDTVVNSQCTSECRPYCRLLSPIILDLEIDHGYKQQCLTEE